MAASQSQLTTKDLGILQDQLNQEALAYKKCDVYSGYFTDPALKNLAMQMKKHHKQNFDGLFSYLNGN